jgi:uncharacterized protein (DUF1015 family)
VVETKAFRPFEYSQEKVELASVVAPPFDVIDAAQAHALKARSPYNVAHLTIQQGKTAKGRIRKPTKTTHAKVEGLLEKWTQEGVLTQGQEDTVYAYEARYTADGQERTMRGVVLLVRVDAEYEQVRPHEHTFEKAVAERLGLLKATAWDLEPIELLYPGVPIDGTLWSYLDGTGRAPDLLATSPDGTQHLYWRITDKAVVGTITHGLKGRKAYIADGHHRYATHLAYSAERRRMEYRPPRDAPYEYKMCVLVNANDAGLSILPTHRIVLKSPRKRPEAIVSALEEYFDVVKLDGDESVAERVGAFFAKAEKPSNAVYLGKRPGLLGLTARAVPMPEELAPKRSFAWRLMDVAYAQQLVVGRAFGVPEKKWGDDVLYTQDWDDAVRMVDNGNAVGAAFHRPVAARQLRAVVDAGEVMPQKSTYFFPKMLSGACFYRIGKEPAGREIRKPYS